MSNCTLIIGPSGSGKSTSIRNLDPEQTFIISVLDKPLPFRGYKKTYRPISGWDDTTGNYYTSDDWARILKCISVINRDRLDIKICIIDDLNYVMANEFMRRVSERGFDKYCEMASHFWQIITKAISCRDDLIFIFISHNEIDVNGVSKCKTIGKLIDEKINVEGLFSTVFHSAVIENEYKFLTQHDGFRTAKSPMGLFDSQFIDNDLLSIIDKIREYYS